MVLNLSVRPSERVLAPCVAIGGIPLRPKLLHYITLLFRINFPDYVRLFYFTELVSNYFLGYVISYVVAEHTIWTWDYIASLSSNLFTGYVISFYITKLVSN